MVGREGSRKGSREGSSKAKMNDYEGKDGSGGGESEVRDVQL